MTDPPGLHSDPGQYVSDQLQMMQYRMQNESRTPSGRSMIACMSAFLFGQELEIDCVNRIAFIKQFFADQEF
jgi:hypothetical protein